MRPLATLEADLWLAQRANRRNPSEENQALVDSIEAKIASLTESSTTAHIAENVDTLTSPEEPAETPSTNTENVDALTSPEEPTETPSTNTENADAQAQIDVKKEKKPKATAKKKEE